MAILNQFSAILLCCDSTQLSASRCGISVDSRPAMLGIVRFAIRDSVVLSQKFQSAESAKKFSEPIPLSPLLLLRLRKDADKISF